MSAEALAASYLVCATPRSGSTLVCQALKDTGIAGRPEEYFEALRHSGRPRRPGGVLRGRRRPLDPRPPGRARVGDEPQQRSPLWSRAAYDRYLEWAMRGRHDAERDLRREADVGLLRRLRQPAAQHPRLQPVPLADLLPRVFPELTFVRVVRANKVRQAVSLWKAVQTATWRQEDAVGGQRGHRRRRAARTRASSPTTGRSCASTTARSSTCCTRSWSRRRTGTPSSSMRGSSPCSSSTRTSPPTTRTRPATCSSGSGSSCRRATS